MKEERVKLEIVRAPRRAPITEEQFRGRQPTQGTLFPLPKQDLLIFVSASRVTEEEFTATLEMARPRTILELRRSPRFDIGSMNRRLAFRRFNSLKSTYYDLSSLSTQEENPNPESLVRIFLNRFESHVEGPILLLMNESVDAKESGDEYFVTRIAHMFTIASKHDWETIHVPHFA